MVLAVNKMDLVDYSKEVFDKIVAEYTAFISPLGVPDVQCIPLSALEGDNVVEKSDRTDRKSTRLNSSHMSESRMPSSA